MPRDFSRTFHVRSFTRRQLRNPFFSHAPQHRLKPWMIVLGCITAIGVLGALCIWAPFFRIHDFRVEGLTTLNPSDVTTVAQNALQKNRYLLFPGNSFLLVKHERILHALDEQYHFAELNIQREGRTLVVQAKERISEIAWVSGDQTVLIDLQGMAVSDASDTVKGLIAARLSEAVDVSTAPGIQPTMPILINKQAEPITLGGTVLTDTAVTFILETDAALRQRGLAPTSYHFDNRTAPWFTVSTTGPEIMFDFTIALEHALVMLDTVRTERDNFAQLAYIDLRFGNHIYVKEP